MRIRCWNWDWIRSWHWNWHWCVDYTITIVKSMHPEKTVDTFEPDGKIWSVAVFGKFGHDLLFMFAEFAFSAASMFILLGSK